MQEATQNDEFDLESKLDQILADLDDCDGKYPKEAITAARLHRDAVIPRLIEAIESAITEWEESGDVEGQAALFALPLLAEFRAQESLPVIFRAISLPNEGAYEIFGDLITECLSYLLVELCISTDRIDALISSVELDVYIRCAGMLTYLEFVYDGRFTREEAVDRLRRHLREAITHQDSDGATQLVGCLADYVPHEAMDDIRDAYQQDLVDEYVIALHNFERILADGSERFTRELQVIAERRQTNLVDSMKDWAWDDEDVPEHTTRDLSDLPFQRILHLGSGAGFEDELEEESYAPPFTPAAATIRYTEARVGRNDPCPCGSGKKFKKCCSGQ